MKQIIDSIVNAFRKPIEPLGSGRKAVHQDYKVDDSELPLHFRPPIDRHVLDQKIINKDDFIAFVVEYKTEATKLFYTDRLLKAVFNYSTSADSDYGDSMCIMPLELTEDYTHYSGAVSRPIAQKDFVRFLKRMEPYIIALDNKEADDMDIIEMAENLQGITKVDSIMRNTAKKYTIDAEVRTGKDAMTIPRIITFEFPIYRNDRELTTCFETELFLTAQDGTFIAELQCYNIDQLEEETRRQLTQSICDGIEGVKAFQV